MKQPWPRPGQVWEDKDPRMKGRAVKVDEVAGKHAVVEVVTDREGILKPTVGRYYRVQVARMMQGEYALLLDAHEVPDRTGEEV